MNQMKERIPLKRLATVDDISSLVLFLASEKNTYITGQNIIVDGGYTLNKIEIYSIKIHMNYFSI